MYLAQPGTQTFILQTRWSGVKHTLCQHGSGAQFRNRSFLDTEKCLFNWLQLLSQKICTKIVKQGNHSWHVLTYPTEMTWLQTVTVVQLEKVLRKSLHVKDPSICCSWRSKNQKREDLYWYLELFGFYLVGFVCFSVVWEGGHGCCFFFLLLFGSGVLVCSRQLSFFYFHFRRMVQGFFIYLFI